MLPSETLCGMMTSPRGIVTSEAQSEHMLCPHGMQAETRLVTFLRRVHVKGEQP